MSGFAAIAGPPETTSARIVDAITVRLAWRGPDRTSQWTGSGVTLIHTLFRTSDYSRTERQPLADQGVCVVGDVRLDARDELIGKLQNGDAAAAMAASPDIDLVRHAWLRWGDACVAQLRGDFAFVVWDVSTQRLFGARDQFGVRPFFYAATPDGIVVANDLAALRAHPGVSRTLDDKSITDILAFGQPQDVSATAFSAIRRLQGGHRLTWRAGCLDVQRYWGGLPERPIRFHGDDDYLERYRELLSRAVADRVRSSSVAVTLTGGLDSSSIAATAHEIQFSRGYINGVHAHTIAYDRLLPDDERRFAESTARHLGLTTSVMAADDYPLYARRSNPGPEPSDQPFQAMLTDFYQRIARKDRVLLMGLDGDTFLCEVASDYLLAQLRRGQFREYANGVRDYVRTRRELPPHRLRSTVRRWTRGSDRLDWATPPGWLNPDVVKRFEVAERWRARRRAHDRLMPGWPLRPRATRVLASPVWASMFDEHDAANLGALIEVRFPLTDLALADFLMNIPAVPWCVDKHVVRRAMTNRLPREVLERPKTPLAGDPVRARLDAGDRLPWSAGFSAHPELGRYVDLRAIADLVAGPASDVNVGVDTRALSLNDWLWYHLPRSDANGATADTPEAAQVAARA